MVVIIYFIIIALQRGVVHTNQKQSVVRLWEEAHWFSQSHTIVVTRNMISFFVRPTRCNLLANKNEQEIFIHQNFATTLPSHTAALKPPPQKLEKRNDKRYNSSFLPHHQPLSFLIHQPVLFGVPADTDHSTQRATVLRGSKNTHAPPTTKKCVLPSTVRGWLLLLLVS